MGLSRAVVFQRVQLDATVDQVCDDAENERMFGQLIGIVAPESEICSLPYRMFNHNAV
jgi:hypothetical protein